MVSCHSSRAQGEGLDSLVPLTTGPGGGAGWSHATHHGPRGRGWMVSCHSSRAQGEGLDGLMPLITGPGGEAGWSYATHHGPRGRGWICNSPFTLWYYSPHDIECVFVSRLRFSSFHFFIYLMTLNRHLFSYNLFLVT